MTELKQIEGTYETKQKDRDFGDIVIKTRVRGKKIEILDNDCDCLKVFVFSRKDTPENRKYWLKILKTIEAAVKLTPKI
jgi:hypothetical protein